MRDLHVLRSAMTSVVMAISTKALNGGPKGNITDCGEGMAQTEWGEYFTEQ